MQTKHCHQCDTTKPVSEFNRRGERWQGRCRDCQRGWYTENREQHLQNVRRNNDRYREEVSAYLVAYLLEHPCVDCGEDDPIVLDFDHVHGKKTKGISELYRQGHTLRAVQREIEKCEVRCANCHRRATARRAGNWRKSLVSTTNA